ncbi:thioredoxin-like domain-containing protein [Dipodascopsis uninucleata]
MVKQSMPAVSTLGKEGLEEFKTADDVVLVGFFSDAESNATFTKVAEFLRDSFLFGATSDLELAKAESVTPPAVVMYKKFDDNKLEYGGDFEAEDIISFAKVESMPLVGDVSQVTYMSYMQSGLPLGYIFAEADGKAELAKLATPIAKKYRGKINVATIDVVPYGQHAENLNLKQEWPAIAIHDIANNLKYTYPQPGEVTESGLFEFFDKFAAGDLKPTIKSQPAPETQDGPVYIVTANTYDEIVLDDSKDVLIEFYATWCGHCKNLAPKYDELGSIFWDDEELRSKVTIAKVDTPENDVPDEVAGFPTIKLYPAGDKSNPIEYSGDRTVKSLADFVRDNGKYGIDGYAIYEKKMAEKKAEDETDAEGEKHDEL